MLSWMFGQVIYSPLYQFQILILTSLSQPLTQILGKKLTKDPTDPLHDRSISSYASGSTFKTVVALAALKSGTITPETTIYSPQSVHIANRMWSDWYKGDRGNINVKTAMQWSCNTFFYQLGVRTGIAAISEMGKLVGFGDKLLQTIDGQPILPTEQAGLMPDPQWMKNRAQRALQAWKKRRKEDPEYKKPRPAVTWERWSNGHTCNTSIGQGYVAITPLQMTTMMAAVANGGTIYYPRLVRGITNVNEQGETELIKEYEVRKQGELGLKPSHLNALRESLRLVVTSGTGKRAAVEDFAVCGKTGTAQFTTFLHGRKVKDNRAWFNGYAPAENPRYAISVIVEGGKGGGSTAGPIIHAVMKGIHEMERGGSIDMVYLTPSVGHFSGVTEIAASTVSTSEPNDESPEDFSSAIQEEQNIRRARAAEPRSLRKRLRDRNWRFIREDDD